ncbi:hypothetical protein NDU88_006652 [Pleurodeles waltl]|uniref:Uncharacterized protein n=1 Tax=Pleurodeles waltl TaxID=8319 RepID=A0AAV7VQ89_PLEWA|nr:hypothetical protein NDU88_006652 [Pleurodeles waltl]
MLVWSASESNGGSEEEGVDGNGDEKHSPPMRLRVPEGVYGKQGFSGGQCGDGARGFQGVGNSSGLASRTEGVQGQCVGGGTVDRFNAGTSDFFWQEAAGQRGDNPGEQGAARRPWGRYEGRGCAPTGIAFPGEQRPGASGGDRGLRADPAVRSKDGELRQLEGKEPVARRQEAPCGGSSELDFGEESVEEGEISVGLGEEEQER